MEDIEKLAGELKSAMDSVKQHAEKTMTEIKNLGQATAETKASADKALSDMNAISARMGEIEQKMARRGGDAERADRSLGEIVTESEQFKSVTSSYRGRASATIEYKDITTANTTVGAGRSPATSLVGSQRVAGIFGLSQRRLTIRDLLAVGQTTQGSIEYVKQTGFTNSAAPVAEGALKPKSDMAFNLMNVPVRTIAHFVKASRQIMDDAPQLRSFIDAQMTYGLDYVEENQILYGNGTGQNLLGIIPQATAFALPSGATAVTTPIDRVRMAMLQAVLAEYPPTGVVLHHTDWANMEVSKDTTGQYIIGDPQGSIVPRLWNLPVVATQAITAGTFLTGSFNLGAQLWDRMSIEILLSTENEDDFVKNMVTIRAERREALAVYRPESFVTGPLVAA